MPVRPRLSILLLARDEAARLPAFFAALKSLRVPYEIVLLENQSVDGTPTLARRLGARVISVRWKGYGATKNAGQARCRAPWIWSLDADENPDIPMLRGVEAALESSPAVYSVNRLNYFLGEPVRHGGWSPDWHPRLFPKGKALFDLRPVHEGLRVTDQALPLLRLPGVLHHDSYPNLDAYMIRLNRYTGLQARELFERHGARPGLALLRAVFDAPFTFLKMFVLKRGFLDGSLGLYLAILSASSTFWKHAKWWHLSFRARGGRAGAPWVVSDLDPHWQPKRQERP